MTVHPSPASRAIGAIAALFCAASVALGAYAAHAVDGDDRARLQTAVLYLFLHGIALIALQPRTDGIARPALASVLVLGVLLFAGSLVGAVLAGWSTRLAPVGGAMLIIGWIGWAVALAAGPSRRG